MRTDLLNRYVVLIVGLLTMSLTPVWGEEVTYTWTYSNSTFTISSSGTKPDGSSATLTSTYTDGNQLTGGKTQTFTLSGYDGCTITGISINLKRSSSASATANIEVSANGSQIGSSSSTTLTKTQSDYNISITETKVETGKTVVITVNAEANSIYVYNYKITYSDTPKQETTIKLSEAGVEKEVSGTFYVGGEYTLPSSSEATCGTKKFVGWSTVEIATSSDKPASNFYAGGATVTLEENNTFYAVFATETSSGRMEESLSQTLQYDTWTYSGSTTNKSSYRLFHTDSYIESAEFDLSTLSKVIVYGGTFGGTSYKNLNIGDGTNTWKDVTISGSSQTGVNTYTDGTSLSGTGKLRVTSKSGTASDNGVRISKVEIYTRGGTSYSDYTTSCSTTPTYTAKVDPAPENGTIKLSSTENGTYDQDQLTGLNTGDWIYFSVTPNSDYSIATVTVNDNGTGITSLGDNKYKYQIQSEDVAVSATFSSVPTLSFVANGGNVDPTSTTTSPATLPTPTKTGYNFEGWYENADLSDASPKKAGNEYPFTESKTLYAKWSAKKTTITLDWNGGSAGATSVTATYGEALPSFTLATRDETNTYQYRLIGYFTTKTGGGDIMVIDAEGKLVKSVSGYTDESGNWIKEDATLTLNARWDNYCKVEWINNGTTVATTYVKQNTTIGESADGMLADLTSAEACSPTHTTFVGWYTEASGEESNPANAAPATKVTGSTQVTAKVKYYAVWANGDIRGKEISYTITFGNNATGNTSINTSTKATTIIKEGSTYVLTQPVSATTNSYYGDNQTSIRIGKSNDQGSVTLNLSDAGKVAAHKIVVNTKLYNSNNSATLSVNSASAQTISATANDLTFIFDGSSVIDAITLSTSLYAFIYSITVYSAEPSTATEFISSCCNSPAVVTVSPSTTNLKLNIDGEASTTLHVEQTGGGSGRYYAPTITPLEGAKTNWSGEHKTGAYDVIFTATAAGIYTFKGNFTETAGCAKYGSATISVVANPILAASVGSLTVNGQCGVAGAASNFTVNSRYLTSNTVTAKASTTSSTGGKYTISTDGTTYSESVTFEGGASDKASQTIYVRYEAGNDENGNIAGSISITGGGAAEQTVGLSGECTCGTYITLTPTDDNTTHITAPKGQWTQAQTPIKIHGGYLQKNINTGNGVNIKLTSSNPNFKFTKGATTGEASSESGKVTAETYDQDIYIVYTPTDYNQNETAIITAQVITYNGSTVQAEQTITVYGRSLPETFVLAVNTGSQWVAVPADMVKPFDGCSTGVGTHDPYPITVDNQSDPTKATIVPKRAIYKGASRCTPTTNPWTVRFESQSQTGYYLWGSASVAEGDEGAATGDALTTIANQNYATSEREKWVLETKDNTTYQIHLDATLNTNKLGYNGTNSNTGNRIGQYKNPASTYKYDFRILPIEGELCEYYINPEMTYSAYDATHSVLSIPYDGTTAYEYSTDRKNTWTAVTGDINCSKKTLELTFSNSAVKGKELWLRAAGTVCLGDATSVTATHMLNPTITATTPKAFTGVQNTAFTGSFDISLSDIWTGTGGGVVVSSSNGDITASLSTISGSPSYTGNATITLNMAAKPAGDYTTTLTLSSVGAATQTVQVTIHILSLATQEFNGRNDYWFTDNGFFCGNAGTDYYLSTIPTISLSYALYKGGSVFTDAWGTAGTFTMYDMTSGSPANSGWYKSGTNSSGVISLTLQQSYFTAGHTYKLVWENTANLTDASGLQYANCEMTFIYTDNCDAPTATEPCVTGSESAVINWAGECDATNSTVSVYTKTEGTSLQEVTAFSTTNVKNLQYAGETNIAGADWITNIEGSGSGAPSISSNKLLITDVKNDKYYNLFSPKLSNFGTISTDKEYKITITLSQSTTDANAKVTFFIMDCSSNDLATNTTPTITNKNIQIDGTNVSSKLLSNSITNTFVVKGLTGTDRIRLLGSESSSLASSDKNVYISSIKIETNGEQIQVSGSPFSATCAEGNKEITGLSANTTYYATVTNNGNTSNEVSFKTYASGTKSLVFKSEVSEVTEVMVLGGESQHTDITVAGQHLAGCDITTNISAGYSVDESGLSFDPATGKVSGTVVFTLTDPAVTEGTYTITDGVGTVYTLHLTSTNCPAGFNTMATDATDITANTATANWTGSVTNTAGTLLLYKDGIVNRELIENGGFETGDFIGWNDYDMGYGYSCDKYEVASTNKHSGEKCLYVSETGSHGLTGLTDYSVIYSNAITLAPGTYRLSAWVNVKNSTGNDNNDNFVLALTGGYWDGSKSQPQMVYAKSEVFNIVASDGYKLITADLEVKYQQKCHPVIAVIGGTGESHFRPFYLDDVSLMCISAKENNEPYMTIDITDLSAGNQALSGLSGNTQYRYMLQNADGCESNIVTFVTAAAEAPTISVASPVSISAPMGSSSSGMAIVTVTDAYDAVAITSCNDGRITLGSSTLPAEGGALNFTFRPKDGTDAPGDKGTCTVSFITHGMSTPTTLDIEWTVSSGMDPGTELIEVTDISNEEITIEHNVPGKVDDVRVVFNREVSPDDVDENVGDEIFFSKYYEAYMHKKLWAIYNPTGRKISLEGMEVWRSQGSEKDGYSWNHTEAMDLSTMGQNEKGWIYPNEEIIVYTSNEVGTCEQSKADMSTWEPRSSEDKALSFSGDDALLLVRKKSAISEEKDNELPTTSVNGDPISWPDPLTIDAEQWYMLDIIGARSETYQPDCSACKTWNWTNCVANESVSGDAEGWVGYGYDMSDNKNNYSKCDGGGFLLSTNRCLLVRRMDVKSGANALAINMGNMETLNTEWKGSHVPTGGDQAAVSCENFSYVGGYDYAGYYNHYVPLPEKEYTSLGKNPDGSWSFETDVPSYYCKILRIEVVETQTINGVEADNVHAYIDYKVPIVVDNTKNTTDKIFKFGGDTCANCDVVIRDKAQLSHIIGGQGQFRDMYVYPGAKLSNEAGQTLQMRSIYMQALNDTVSYAIVENNTSTILSDKVVHTKRIDDKYWYPFSLPYDCDIAAIRQLNGKSLGKYEGPGVVDPSQYGTWTIKYYDGQARQASGTSAGAGNASNFWIEMPAGGTLKAHQAYIIGLYETDWEGQHKTVLFPPKAGSEYTESGVDKKETTVVNWPDNLSCAARHHGWNFVGSPYISMFNEDTDGQGMNNGSVVMKGKISGDDTPYIETDYVFLSIPDGRDTRTYTQVLASATKIEPFKGYFVQVVDPTTGVSETKTLEYAKSNRTLEKAPSRAAAASAQKIFVELNILAPDAQKDNAGILVADHYTASYEIGGDLTKMYAAAGKPQLYTVDAQNEKMAYQALPEPLAHAIPLEFYAPTVGQYILSIARGASRLADAQAVRLLYEGSQVADLLTSDYTIAATGRGIVSGYTIDIQRAPEVSTWVQGSEAGAAVVSAEEQTITIRQIPDHATVQIVDMLGRVLLQQTANSSTMHFTVPAVGVYQVVIRSQQTNQVAKVIVK